MEIIHETIGIEICCHNLTCDASTTFLHWHENYEICQVLNKPARFLVDGHIIPVMPGDLVTAEESVVHRFLIDQPQTMIRVIQFPTRILLNANTTIKPLQPHITREEICSIPGLEQKLQMIFTMMEAEVTDSACPGNPFLQSLSASLYYLLMRCFPAEKVPASNAKEKHTFFRILEYINANYTEKITVQSIAEALFLSRNVTASVFAKYSGTTINSYVNMLRINKANLLLKQGCNITEAALESGFQSIRNFNLVYKRITGTTPSQQSRDRYLS